MNGNSVKANGENKYRTLLENLPQKIFQKDRDLVYVSCNENYARDLKIKPEEIIGKTDYEFFPKELAEKYRADDIRILTSGETEDIEEKYVQDGQEMWVHTVKTPIKDGKGNIKGVIGIFWDITEQKRVGEALRETEEHIRTLTQELMKAQEGERQRISRDLHDRVAQDLSTLKIGLDTLFDNQPEGPPEMRQMVSELSKMLQETIMAVRGLAYDLRPAGLDQMGLVRSVHEYCEEFSSKNQVKVDFFASGIDELKLDFDTEITLYRLIQESLNNVRKHADASQVTMRLVASFPNIILRIEDNGKGFDVEDRLGPAVKEKRMGLRTMQERVALLQGKTRIESRLTEGTKIFIEFPYRGKNNGK